MYTTPAIDAAERDELQTVEADARAAEQQATALEEAVRNGDTSVTMRAIRDAEGEKDLAGLRLEAVRRKYAQQREQAAVARAQEVHDDVEATLGAHSEAIAAARDKLREATAELLTAVRANNADTTRLIRAAAPVLPQVRALGVVTLGRYGEAASNADAVDVTSLVLDGRTARRLSFQGLLAREIVTADGVQRAIDHVDGMRHRLGSALHEAAGLRG